MSLSDFAGGLNNALREQRQERSVKEALAERMRQARADEDFRNRELEMRSRQYSDEREATAEARRATQLNQQVGLANTLADQLPAGQFVADNDPVVGMLRVAGRGSLLTPQDERPRVDEGPLLPSDTGAARPKGFLKVASANQANVLADNERAAAQARATADTARTTSEHQAKVDAETARHNRAVEGSTAETRTLAGELQRLKIEGEQAKQAKAKADAERAAVGAQDITKSALDLVDRLDTHPGIGAATGAYELRGFTQDAQDFNSIRDQLVAALALPNLGALKGPMSDKDIAFVKNLSTRLGNTRISAEETRSALSDARRFLGGKLAAAPSGTGMISMVAPDGRRLSVPADKVGELETHGAKRVAQ